MQSILRTLEEVCGLPYTVDNANNRQAFSVSKPPEKHGTPSGLRTPDLILGDQVTTSQNIWSFGCVPLFILNSLTTDADRKDVEHFVLLFDIIGPLPDSILSRWSRAHIYFDDKGQNIKSHIGKFARRLQCQEESAATPFARGLL